MTDQEFQELYQYAKLGKAALELMNKPLGEHGLTDVCETSEMFNDDKECKACFAYEFCKLRQEVDK